MEKTLQHKEAPQCIGVSPTGSGNHHTDGTQADAAQALHKLCKGRTIRAEICDVEHYGRVVAHCSLSVSDVSAYGTI